MPGKRLSDAQKAEIRRLYALRGPKTYNIGTLAGMFGTSKATIRNLTAELPRGTNGARDADAWSHLTDR